MYVELLKALRELLSSALNSALNFYIKVVEDLKEKGFELNPHNGFVANKILDGKYQSVC